MFDSTVLSKILRAERDEWRRVHNEQLYVLYSSPNIIRVIKSRRMRQANHVARMADRRSGGTRGKETRNTLAYILKWIFKKQDREAWTGLIWLRRGSDSGLWRVQ
jgi:hypothetical protein